MLRRGGLVTILVAMVAATVATAHSNETAAAANARADENSPAFTVQAVDDGNLTLVNSMGRAAGFVTRQSLSPGKDGLSYVAARSSSGEDAVLDASLIDEGILVATGADFVDLSWRKEPDTREYLVYDGNELIAKTDGDSVRDTEVTPGSLRSYRIIPVRHGDEASPVDVIPAEEPQIFGVKVRIPDTNRDVVAAAEEMTKDAGLFASNESWVKVNTFIPQSRIDAPPVGCDYGSGYQFHGDGRSFSPVSIEFRTSLVAFLRWDDPGPRLTGFVSDVGETIVYDKSTGEEVERRTASKEDIWAVQLGADTDKVDVRFSIQAGNPFCGGNSIAGAFTMNLYKTGNWILLSGSHRQMPNWEVYIAWSDGEWNTVYQRQYLNEICLIELACPEAEMGGLAGDTYLWQLTESRYTDDEVGLGVCQTTGQDGIENGYWLDFDCQLRDWYYAFLVYGATFEFHSGGLSYFDCWSTGDNGTDNGQYAAFQCHDNGNLFDLWVVYT